MNTDTQSLSIPVYETSESRANGPGLRYVVWVEGCPFRCRGCFNAHIRKASYNRTEDTGRLAAHINTLRHIDGVTLSGGEPLLYPEAVARLLGALDSNLTRIIFTGYTYSEIRSSIKLTKAIMHADLVIAGRYDSNLPNPYLGKEFVNISGRIDLNYFKPVNSLEYDIMPDGKVIRTGIVATKRL